MIHNPCVLHMGHVLLTYTIAYFIASSTLISSKRNLILRFTLASFFANEAGHKLCEQVPRRWRRPELVRESLP